METPGWQKALVVAGGAAATAGLLWYLFREGEEEPEQPEQDPMEAEATAYFEQAHRAGAKWFKVTDKKMYAIGIRVGPDVEAQRAGGNVQPGEVFAVYPDITETSMAVQLADGSSSIVPQRYMRLLDGRGWVFTHSSKDGRLLAEEISAEEARAGLEQPSGMRTLMKDAQEMLARDPALFEQIMSSQAAQGMMANPDMLLAAAQNNPSVAEALGLRPGLQEALLQDPTAVGDALRGAGLGGAAQPPPPPPKQP